MDEAEAVHPPEESLPLTDYDALCDNRVGWALSEEDMERLTSTGNIGDPTVANPEKGEALVGEAVGNVAELVRALEVGKSNGD